MRDWEQRVMRAALRGCPWPLPAFPRAHTRMYDSMQGLMTILTISCCLVYRCYHRLHDFVAALCRIPSLSALSLVHRHASSANTDMPYPTYEEAIHMSYRPAKVGDAFGPSWTTHWFLVRATVPTSFDGLGPLMFR